MSDFAYEMGKAAALAKLAQNGDKPVRHWSAAGGFSGSPTTVVRTGTRRGAKTVGPVRGDVRTGAETVRRGQPIYTSSVGWNPKSYTVGQTTGRPWSAQGTYGDATLRARSTPARAAGKGMRAYSDQQ